MRRFECMELNAAYQHAAEGGQALHLHRIIVNWDKAPACFKAAINRGEDIAHLIDLDEERLRRTVRRLGVRVVVVEHRGRKGQHVDLCGAPLRKAVAMCEPDPAI